MRLHECVDGDSIDLNYETTLKVIRKHIFMTGILYEKQEVQVVFLYMECICGVLTTIKKNEGEKNEPMLSQKHENFREKY